VAILGIPFDPVTTDQTVELIAEMIASRQPHYLVTANVDFVVQAEQDPELLRILFHAHLVLCDGMPLVWASRFLGNRSPSPEADLEIGTELRVSTIARLRALGVEDPALNVTIERQGTGVAVAADYKEVVRHPFVNKITVLIFRPAVVLERAP